MDLIERAKEIMRPKPAFKEGDASAYIILGLMSDKEVKRRYMGVAPVDVPREAQLELYTRFVQKWAMKTCNECHGLGRTGWVEAIHQYKPCQCLQRVIRNEVGKENKLVLLSN